MTIFCGFEIVSQMMVLYDTTTNQSKQGCIFINMFVDYFVFKLRQNNKHHTDHTPRKKLANYNIIDCIQQRVGVLSYL